MRSGLAHLLVLVCGVRGELGHGVFGQVAAFRGDLSVVVGPVEHLFDLRQLAPHGGGDLQLLAPVLGVLIAAATISASPFSEPRGRCA